MRTTAPALLLLSAAACATVPGGPPPPSRSLAAGTVSEAFACGMRQVNELGYIVADADRAAGFIRADRDRTSFSESFFQGLERYDQLTLTIYPREDGRTVLRVVSGGYEVEQRGENKGARVSHVGSDRARTDVQAILEACGEPVADPVA